MVTHHSTDPENYIGLMREKLDKDKQYEINYGLPRYGEIVLKALTQSPKIRDGIQITELNLCHRQKIFQLKDPKPQSPQNTVRAAAGTA